MGLYGLEAITGVAVGGLYALVAIGITQIYKVTRVFNFAHSAFILYAALFYSVLTDSDHMWTVPAALISLTGVGLMGVASELLIFKFARRSTAASKIILTFGLLELLSSAAAWIFGGVARGSVPIVSSSSVGMFGTRIGFIQIGEVVTALVLVLLIAGFLRYTRLGLLTRATAEDAVMAEILGARPTVIGCFNWALSAILAGIAGIFIVSSGPVTQDEFYTYFVFSLVAVVFGGLSSLALTVLGGLLLGVATNEIIATNFSLGNVCIFAVLVLLVIFRRNWPVDLAPARGPRSAILRDESTSWALSSLFALVFIGGWLALSIAANGSLVWSATLGIALIYSLACLSLVPIIRWTGQVSLAQAGLMGIGAFATVSFDQYDHLPFPLAMVLGALIAGFFGALLGAIVRKLSFILAAVVSIEFMNIAGTFEGGKYAPWVHGGFGGIAIRTPRYLVTGDRFDIGTAIVAGIALFCLTNVRHSSWGDRFLGAKISPVMARHFGIGPSRSRIYAYALSGAIAGLAGSVYVVFLSEAYSGIFTSTLSLYVLIYAVVGGVTVFWGPFLGALLFIAIPQLFGLARFGSSPVPLMVQGALLIVLCATSLDGLAGFAKHPSGHLPSFALAKALLARLAPAMTRSAAASEALNTSVLALGQHDAQPVQASSSSGRN